METIEAIKRRKTTRAFSDKLLEQSKLDIILKAGCLAPVGMSAYDKLHLTVVRNSELMNEIDKISRAQYPNPDVSPLFGATTLIILSASPRKLPNIELSDAGCVLENMILMATDLKVDNVYLWGCTVAISQDVGLSVKMGIPEGFSAVGCLALGYAVHPKERVRELEMSISMNMIE